MLGNCSLIFVLIKLIRKRGFKFNLIETFQKLEVYGMF